GQQDHGAAKRIGYKNNPKRCFPVSCVHNQDALIPHRGKQVYREPKDHKAPDHTEHALCSGFLPEKQQDNPNKQLGNDGQYNQIVYHKSSSSGVLRSSKSSVPIRAYTRFNNTIAKDCKPKLITIAVRISAWGMGSA